MGVRPFNSDETLAYMRCLDVESLTNLVGPYGTGLTRTRVT